MHFEGEFHSAALRHQEAAFNDSCIVGPPAVDVCVHVSVLSRGFTKSSASSVGKERCKKNSLLLLETETVVVIAICARGGRREVPHCCCK